MTTTATKTSLKKCKRLDQSLGKEKESSCLVFTSTVQNVKISGFVSVSEINCVRCFHVVVLQ